MLDILKEQFKQASASYAEDVHLFERLAFMARRQ